MRQADLSFSGFLLTLLRRCVWTRNLVNEEAMAEVGPQLYNNNQNNYNKNVYKYINKGNSLGQLIAFYI